MRVGACEKGLSADCLKLPTALKDFGSKSRYLQRLALKRAVASERCSEGAFCARWRGVFAWNRPIHGLQWQAAGSARCRRSLTALQVGSSSEGLFQTTDRTGPDSFGARALYLYPGWGYLSPFRGYGFGRAMCLGR